MTLPSTYQYYLVLKALGVGRPMHLGELVEQMKVYSRKEFGVNELYVFSPAPLSNLLSEMKRNGDVLMKKNDASLAITEQGRAELANTKLLISASA